VFPPVSSGGKKSSITAAHIEGQLEGRTVEKVTVIPFIKEKEPSSLPHSLGNKLK
jgi:hypothetical protein